MKQTTFRNKRSLEKRIELYCRSMEEILTKIQNRVNAKPLKSRRKKRCEEIVA